MVHRKARNEMAAALRAYMEEKTTAFQFDDALTQIADATDDETVRRIGDVLWLYYDDIKDHQVVASKTDWGFFNRALLLLESEAEMDVSTTWRWHASQGVAAAGLAAWAYLAVHTGLGEHLLYL